MTDTSIVKPLAWRPFSDANGSGFEAEASGVLRYIVLKEPDGFYCAESGASASDEATIKGLCRTDHESEVLRYIDLTAHDAKVRAEALEGVIVFLKDAASNVRKQLPGDTQQQADGWRYAANLLDALILDIRALKGEG